MVRTSVALTIFSLQLLQIQPILQGKIRELD